MAQRWLFEILSRARAKAGKDTVSGKIITWDEAMASNFQFCPNVDSLNADIATPVKADSLGRYPTPIPGQWSEI